MIEPFILVEHLSNAIAGVVLAAGPPAWVWATLLMAGFAALTVFTMLLVRIPTRGSPPTLEADGEVSETEMTDDDGATDVDDA